MNISGVKIQKLESNSRIKTNICSPVNIFAIFILLFFLFAGLTFSDLNVYSQSNETSSPSENVVQTNPDNPPEENVGITEDEKSVSEITSSGLEGDRDNQSTLNKTSQEQQEVLETSNPQPDRDCLFDPSLPKCAPNETGKCPEGFGMNGDGQCFPRHDRCPEGYHSHEDDESGRCIPNEISCDTGYIMNPDYPSCENKDRVCQEHPDLKDCKQGDGGPNNLPYKSGYDHGCSDAKIFDPDNRYINQPEKGPQFHTNEFLRGYNDGFEKCSNGSNPPSTSKGTFKVIVEVINQIPHDISGGITVSVDPSPDNIVKAAYDLYFPEGETVYKTFTFESRDVPIGKEFEVNID